jgi:dienelactone hydrolase
MALTLLLIFLAAAAMAQKPPEVPFAKRQVVLENGIIGKPLTFESANPRNFEDIVSKATVPAVKLDGQLFVPIGQGPRPVVVLVPGSGGVSQDNLEHAQHLTSARLAVYVVDPFTGRGVKDTVADQGQVSRAASTYDVLAAARTLATQPGIDGQRIGAFGCSRGGMAVLLAAIRPVARAILGEGRSLKAVLAAWPWCGYQFENPITDPTAVRFLVADSDNYASPVQCQGQAAAMRAYNPQVSIRLFKEAYHGFGYYFPLRELPNAVKAVNSPTLYINDQGAFLDWYTGQPVPGADDHYFYRLRAPWEERGAIVGTRPGQSEAFVTDMVGFFTQQMRP